MSAGTLADHIAQHLVQARTVRLLDEELGTHHGIDWPAFLLLGVLDAEGGELAAARAAATLGLTPTRLLLQVLPLEKLGWVGRRQGEGARRLVLTPAGRRLLGEARETAQGVLLSPSPAAAVRTATTRC